MKQEKLEIEKYLSKDILKKLPVRTYKPGELIRTIEDTRAIYIVEGEAKGVRYENGVEIVYPYIFKKGDFLGGYERFLFDKDDWEWFAINEFKGIVFVEEDVDKYIIKNYELLEFVLKGLFKITTYGIRGFYIQSRGGAKSHLAYLLVNFAKEDGIPQKTFINYSNILGVSRRMLNKITKGLIEEGAIKKQKERIIIVDIDILTKYYEDYIY